MAYSVTVDAISSYSGGRQTLLLVVEETDAGPADQWTYSGAFWLPTAKILSYYCGLTAGTAATVAPSAGRSALYAPGGGDEIIAYAAAAYVSDDPLVYVRNAENGIFGNSRPDAGADNVIRTEILFEALGDDA